MLVFVRKGAPVSPILGRGFYDLVIGEWVRLCGQSHQTVEKKPPDRLDKAE